MKALSPLLRAFSWLMLAFTLVTPALEQTGSPFSMTRSATSRI